MPIAAPIMTLPASALPAPLEPRGAHGKAAASSREFGELFREEAGPMQVPVPKAASAVGKSSEEGNPPVSGDMAEVSPITEQAESAFSSAILPDSSQASLQMQSQNQLHATANSEARLPDTPVEVSGLSLSLSKTASTSESSVQSPTQLPIQSKDANSPSSTQATGPQHKTREESHASKPGDHPGAANGTPVAAAGQLLTPSVLPAAASSELPPVPQPAPVSSAIERTAEASGKNRGTSAGVASAQNATEEKDTAPQSASAEDQPAAPLASDNHPFNGSQPPSSSTSSDSKNAGREPAPAAEDSSTSSRGSSGASLGGSSELLSAAVHSSLAPRHPAEQGTGGAIAAVGSTAMPSEAHSTEAGTSATALPRMEQPAAPANSATLSAASPATNLATNLYDKIDQGAAPVVLHSGAQHVAVGVRDPDLGWVEIKTQNTAGQLAATLITASGQIHATLTAQLPAMAQYLHDRDVRVGTLAVHQEMPGGNSGSGPNNGPGNSGSGNGGAGNSGSGNGGAGAQHPNRPDSSSEGPAARYAGASPEFLSSGFLQSGAEDAGASLRPVSYISVRA
jgi:hypothetical protein